MSLSFIGKCHDGYNKKNVGSLGTDLIPKLKITNTEYINDGDKVTALIYVSLVTDSSVYSRNFYLKNVLNADPTSFRVISGILKIRRWFIGIPR